MKKMIITTIVATMVTAGICGGIINNNNAEHDAKIEAMEADIDLLNKRINSLSMENDGLRQNYDILDESYNDLTGKYDALDETYDELTTEVLAMINGGNYNIRITDPMTGTTKVYHRPFSE